MSGIERAVRVPLSPIERVERARRELLAKHERQDRARLLRPLSRRLKREGRDDLAVEVALVAKDGAVVLYGRTRDEERAALKAVLNRLARLVGTFTPAESEALFRFLALVDAWSEPELN